eukprot:gene10634-biopygen8199
MTPFKTSAMPWAFIVLLLATSSTCSGLSARRMVDKASDATAATAATATAATAAVAAATTAATATAAALTTADTAAAAATVTAAAATAAATTTAAAAAAAAAAGSGRKLMQSGAPAATLTAAAAAAAATATAATAAAGAATTAATAALVADTTAANAVAAATLTSAAATASAITTAAVASATGAARRLQQRADTGGGSVDVNLPPTSGTAKSPATVELGDAEAFTVLSSATVTNTVGSSLRRYHDLYILGHHRIPQWGPCNQTYAASAKLDVTTAYNDAASRTDNVVNINQVDVGGLTYTPGLYKTTTALEVSSGDLTLSGEGNSSGVFIFQIKTTFELGSAGLFEVDSEVVGTVLGESKVVLLTDAKIEGRLFSNNAAVTLDSNEVDFPDEDTAVVPGPVVITP